MPLSPPPRDATGEVIPHDHSGIAPAAVVIRRISEKQIVIDKFGHQRISSMAFTNSSDIEGISIDFEALILEAKLDPKKHVTTPRWIGSVALAAQDLRDEDFRVGYDPLPDNAFHGQAWGKSDKKKAKRLQIKIRWYVPIPGVRTAPA